MSPDSNLNQQEEMKSLKMINKWLNIKQWLNIYSALFFSKIQDFKEELEHCIF